MKRNLLLFRKLLFQFLFKKRKKERKKGLRHRKKILIRGKNIIFFLYPKWRIKLDIGNIGDISTSPERNCVPVKGKTV